MANEFREKRGFPWEFDPGPPRNRKWPRLFAETPNYRGLGVQFTGHEKFRWHFGPMFYRGRLRDNRARVLVVGQEGAQDESLSHRSFTGGTGARLQYFLDHIGITRSYLFLNTFVYPIFGQYVGDDDLQALGQDLASPIVKHRHELFDYVVARHDLRLVVAVGTAAKETIATWVESKGGTADPSQLHEADGHVIDPLVRILGVRHPGGAGVPGAIQAIIADFKAAIGRVADWASEDPEWLPPDSDGNRRPASQYKYRSAPVPFRDLPYGVAWRLGRGGTSSNRRNGQRAIQIFSADGKYDNKGHTLTYSENAAGDPEGYSDEPGDLPYEPPRGHYREFDNGPPPAFARLLQGGEPDRPWPDFGDFGVGAHPSMGYGPIYRGRLDNPSILVLADQQSHDDLFTARALTGDGGQHLQAFLRAAGLTERYAILRVLPVDTLEEQLGPVRAAVDDPRVRAIYAEAIVRAQPAVLLAAGPNARRMVDDVNSLGVPVVKMRSFGQTGVNSNWRAALLELQALSYEKDLPSPSFDYQGEREQIPRHDLPYGTPRWQGSSGDRALQALRSGNPSPDYYKLVMPEWVAALEPAPLSSGELRALDELE